ncbi:MAG: hypothetical protein ACFFBJ_12905 [Promethearchaeota archaeon]
MILPIIISFLAGRFVGRRNRAFILGMLVGLVLGILAGLEVLPLLYPLMIVRIPWVGVPEIRRIGLAFGHQDLVLFAESIHFQSFSFTMFSILVVVSIAGAIIGGYLGIKSRGTDFTSPWQETTEDV